MGLPHSSREQRCDCVSEEGSRESRRKCTSIEHLLDTSSLGDSSNTASSIFLKQLTWVGTSILIYE